MFSFLSGWAICFLPILDARKTFWQLITKFATGLHCTLPVKLLWFQVRIVWERKLPRANHHQQTSSAMSPLSYSSLGISHTSAGNELKIRLINPLVIAWFCLRFSNGRVHIQPHDRKGLIHKNSSWRQAAATGRNPLCCSSLFWSPRKTQFGEQANLAVQPDPCAIPGLHETAGFLPLSYRLHSTKAARTVLWKSLWFTLKFFLTAFYPFEDLKIILFFFSFFSLNILHPSNTCRLLSYVLVII